MQDFKYVGLDILTQAARRYSFLFFYLNWLIIRKFYLNLYEFYYVGLVNSCID